MHSNANVLINASIHRWSRDGIRASWLVRKHPRHRLRPHLPLTPAAQAPAAAAPAPAAAPRSSHWSVGPMDLSGFIDGYYSYQLQPTRPPRKNDQINQLYNFNDKTDQFELSAAKLTLNHDPDPVGAHVDFIYGRTNDLINVAGHTPAGDSYIEQAFLSLKPPKAKGFELDFGKFVTSAGAEVIEAKDNWNYSRSLLFAWRHSLLALRRAHLDAGFEDRNHRLPGGQRLE